jgi:hypothetical protein
MAVLSAAQARSYAAAAGFSGQALSTIVAIAQAESSLNTQAQHTNGDGSIDRGILQINNRWHHDIDNNCAFSPDCAFRAGFSISRGGRDFSAWSTYSSGAYLRFLTTTPGGSAPAPSGGGKPWYTYPRVDNFGTIDPQGDYWKPDSNIQTPPGYAVTAVSPGVITDVQHTSWGQTVVTEKLDQPFNSLATHEFFEHMHDATVTKGQRVVPGILVGHANLQGEGAPLGFGFYPGDTFGSGPEWAQDQADLAPGGAGELNPVGFLDSLSGSTSASTTATTALTTSGGASTPVPLSQQVNELLSEFPGFGGIALALDEAARFPGVIWYNPGNTVQIVPGGAVGDVINGAASAVFDPQDYIGAAIRSVLDTIVSNTVPLLFRGLIVGIGLLLVGGLVWNAVNASGLIGDAGDIAKLGVALV